MPHGEFKTEGGKLVIADFWVNGDRIAEMSVTGDFFLEPPEALERINHALNDMPADSPEEDLASAIQRSLGRDVEMVGFSPEAVAIAVRRGLDDT